MTLVKLQKIIVLFPVALWPDCGPWPSLRGRRDHTHWTHTTLGRTPLREWSARHKDHTKL